MRHCSYTITALEGPIGGQAQGVKRITWGGSGPHLDEDYHRRLTKTNRLVQRREGQPGKSEGALVVPIQIKFVTAGCRASSPPRVTTTSYYPEVEQLFGSAYQHVLDELQRLEGLDTASRRAAWERELEVFDTILFRVAAERFVTEERMTKLREALELQMAGFRRAATVAANSLTARMSVSPLVAAAS